MSKDNRTELMDVTSEEVRKHTRQDRLERLKTNIYGSILLVAATVGIGNVVAEPVKGVLSFMSDRLDADPAFNHDMDSSGRINPQVIKDREALVAQEAAKNREQLVSSDLICRVVVREGDSPYLIAQEVREDGPKQAGTLTDLVDTITLQVEDSIDGRLDPEDVIYIPKEYCEAGSTVWTEQ